MVWMTLYGERRRCSECSEVQNLFIFFVLYEFFCLKYVVVEVDVVDLKVPVNILRTPLPLIFLSRSCTVQLSTDGLSNCTLNWSVYLVTMVALIKNLELNKACSDLAAAFLEYNTNKVVHIKSKKVGLINLLIQMVIMAYLIGYVIVYQKGYQSEDIGLSAVTTKLKGTVLTNLSIDLPVRVNNRTIKSTVYDGPRIWDSSDYVIPPESNGAVFVMTNMIISPRQRQGKCPEDGQTLIRHSKCQTDADCMKGQDVKGGHGIMTGKCVPPDRPVSGNYNVCEIYSWCPVEYDRLPMPGTNFGKPLKNDSCLFEEAINFTLLIKNAIYFPRFDVTLRNVNETEDESHLENCTYDAREEKLCPIFRLKTIFDGISDTAFNDAAILGGVVAIKIKWDCNLDYPTDKCLPEYSFIRVDNVRAKIAEGYNFRVASYDVENNTQYRRLIKAYGIRFVILVEAKAGKFDIVPFLRNLGSGVALLGFATVLCDICVLHLLKKRHFYRSQKYQYVHPDPPTSNDTQMKPEPSSSHRYDSFRDEE